MTIDTKFDEFLSLYRQQVDRTAAEQAAQTIGVITALSFLVKQGLATTGQVAQQLERVRHELQPGTPDPDVTRHIASIAEKLSRVCS